MKPSRPPWHTRLVRKAAHWVEFLSRGRIVHVAGGAKGKGKMLSNFTLAPFKLDGIRYRSFEAFWQSIKFNPGNPIRGQVTQMKGGDAKRAGSTIHDGVMYYDGQIFRYGSKALFNLAKRAERARFLQNPEQMRALLDTGNARLIHWVELRDSKSLPRKVFCRILMELRDEFRKKG
ncbi:MAG: hypothetical protein V1776_01510 [Candidatus Diapherotrites archaeon]